MPLAARIKAARQAAGTQTVVAERIGVTRNSLSQWENGHTYPSHANLRAFADATGVTVEYLLNLDNKREGRLTAWEREWLDLGRSLTPHQRRSFRGFVKAMASLRPPPAKTGSD